VTRCGGPNSGLYVNWPALGFDACHTGYNPYEYRINSTNVQNLVVAWQYGPGTEPFNSPVLVNNVVYFEGTTNVYAVDAGTGALLWTYNTGSEVQNYPAVFNNVLYVGSGQSVYALDAKAGTLLWKYSTTGAFRTGATVADGLVYIGSYGDSNWIIYALDAKTGALRWQRTPGTSSTPTVVNGLVYFGSGGDLYALNAVSGAVVWQVSGLGGISTDGVAVFNNIVYANAGDLDALNALTGAVLWTAQPQFGGNFQSSPVVGAGAVYVGAGATRQFPGPLVYSFDATNGSLLWTGLRGSYGATYELALANGVLYASVGGDCCEGLLAFSSADGSLLWESQNTPGVSPIIANGTVYNPSWDSPYYLYAFHLPNQ
jgi:outer membrane protein assembly factor BamB